MTVTNSSSKPSEGSGTDSATRRPLWGRRGSFASLLMVRQTLLLTLLLLIIGISQYLVLQSVLYRSSANTLRGELSVLSPILHRSISHNDPSSFPTLAALVMNRLRSPGVDVIIANRYNMVVANSSPVTNGLPPVVTNGYALWQGRLVVTEALQDKASAPVGYVWLLTPVDPVTTVLHRDMELYSFLSLLALAATAGLGTIGIRNSLAPLERIIAATVRVARGDYGHASQVGDAPQELRELGEAVNHMSTAVAQAFQAERTAQEEMRRFLADASHELRTPLTAITGFLSLMASGTLSAEETQRGLEAMRREGQRMSRLLTQLTTLSRLDTAPESLVNPVPLALEQWARAMEPTWHSLYPNRNIVVNTEPVTVRADPDRLQEIVLNLLENGARYTPQDTPLTIEVMPREGYGLIQVVDEGPGVPEADLEHIFHRFYRGGKGRARTSGGSGLGLAIVHGLVEAQGGKVSVANRDPHGAIFTVAMPMAATTTA